MSGSACSEKWKDKSGYGIYADGMMELDYVVGELLDKLDDLGIADNTIVMFSTDNGAEIFTWPEGGNHPFRGEKGLTSEGGFRVPSMVRWPAKFPQGKIINDILSHQDWLPTMLAAVGEPNVKEKLLTGYQAGDKRFKAHIDGYNQLDLLTGNGPGKREKSCTSTLAATSTRFATRTGNCISRCTKETSQRPTARVQVGRKS